MKTIDTTKLNAICARCANHCKQTVNVKLIACPRFEAKPIQMEIPLSVRRTRKTISK